MAACDICNAEMNFAEATAFSGDDLQELLRHGFGPPDKVVRMALSAGWTREQVIARWQQELDARPQPYWVFCPACAKRAQKYAPAEEPSAAALPAPEEALAPEGPAADVLRVKLIGEERPAVETAAAPGAAEEVEEEEEEEEEEPRQAGKRSGAGRNLFIGLLIGLLAGGAFYLLVLDRALHPVTPTPVPPTAALETPTTIPLTRALPTRRPATPRPTEFLHPDPRIPVPDLAGAALALADMPSGFREMPAGRQETLGLAEEALAPAFALEQGQLHLLRGWDHPRTGELVVSFFVYPLTPEEQAAFDQGLNQSEAGLAPLWAALSLHGWAVPRRVAALDPVGETGLWLTSVGREDADGLILEIFAARQGPVLEFVLHGYQEDDEPDVELAAPIRTLDARLSALVPPTRLLYVTPAPTRPPVDLAGVALRKEDLPTGFVALAAGEGLAITGMEALSDSQRFAGAVRQSETVFVVPAAAPPPYVLSWVHYPLTEMEAGLLSKSWLYVLPDTGAALLGIPAGNWRSASFLSRLTGVGEAAIGFTGLDNRTRPATRVQVVLVYREGALITLLAGYAEGTMTGLDLVDAARSLDGRLKEALP